MPRETSFRPGDRARVTQGQFEGYEVVVTAVDDHASMIHGTMTVFDRPVELSFSFEQAAGLLSKQSAGAIGLTDR